MVLAHLWREMCLKACFPCRKGTGHLAAYVHRTNFTVDEAKDSPNTGTEWLCFNRCSYERDWPLPHFYITPSLWQGSIGIRLKQKKDLRNCQQSSSSLKHLHEPILIRLMKVATGCHWSLAAMRRQLWKCWANMS